MLWFIVPHHLKEIAVSNNPFVNEALEIIHDLPYSAYEYQIERLMQHHSFHGMDKEQLENILKQCSFSAVMSFVGDPKNNTEFISINGNQFYSGNVILEFHRVENPSIAGALIPVVTLQKLSMDIRNVLLDQYLSEGERKKELVMLINENTRLALFEEDLVLSLDESIHCISGESTIGFKVTFNPLCLAYKGELNLSTVLNYGTVKNDEALWFHYRDMPPKESISLMNKCSNTRHPFFIPFRNVELSDDFEILNIIKLKHGIALRTKGYIGVFCRTPTNTNDLYAFDLAEGKREYYRYDPINDFFKEVIITDTTNLSEYLTVIDLTVGNVPPTPIEYLNWTKSTDSYGVREINTGLLFMDLFGKVTKNLTLLEQNYPLINEEVDKVLGVYPISSDSLFKAMEDNETYSRIFNHSGSRYFYHSVSNSMCSHLNARVDMRVTDIETMEVTEFEVIGIACHVGSDERLYYIFHGDINENHEGRPSGKDSKPTEENYIPDSVPYCIQVVCFDPKTLETKPLFRIRTVIDENETFKDSRRFFLGINGFCINTDNRIKLISLILEDNYEDSDFVIEAERLNEETGFVESESCSIGKIKTITVSIDENDHVVWEQVRSIDPFLKADLYPQCKDAVMSNTNEFGCHCVSESEYSVHQSLFLALPREANRDGKYFVSPRLFDCKTNSELPLYVFSTLNNLKDVKSNMGILSINNILDQRTIERETTILVDAMLIHYELKPNDEGVKHAEQSITRAIVKLELMHTEINMYETVFDHTVAIDHAYLLKTTPMLTQLDSLVNILS